MSSTGSGFIRISLLHCILVNILTTVLGFTRILCIKTRTALKSSCELHVYCNMGFVFGCSVVLTHICRMDFPILINGTSPFPIFGLLCGIFHFYFKGALSWYGKLTWESAHAWNLIILCLLIVWSMTFIFMVHLSFYAIPLLIYDVIYDITTIP